jgi:glutamyl-tRNA synthetase
LATTTRFAPSPTGYLHIGGLRTALFSYLWARKNSGKFLLRIEDTDLSRNSDNAMKAILEAFDWTGLDYDGEAIYQSQRFDLYKKYIDKLLKEGKAYKCYMSKEELDSLRKEQEAKKERPRYDGRYRDFTGTPPQGIEPVIRIKAPLDGRIKFVDGIKGDMDISANEVDDFIIARSSGVPTYNFVVAIDDALMGLTEVIRGDDHLSNTPKQIVVYNALSFDIPKFYHIPLINNPQGKKLSKRDGAMDVMEYKKEGYLPEALINFLVRLGWSHGDKEIFSMDELLEYFNPNNINKSASAYNPQKLDWLNIEYIKATSDDKMQELLKEFDCDISEQINKSLLLTVSKEKAKTLIDVASNINSLIIRPKEYNQKDMKKLINNESISILDEYIELIINKQPSTPDNYESITKPFLESKELKMPHLFKPLRVALLGVSQSPSVYDVMTILGTKEIDSRYKIFKKRAN